MPYDWTKHVDSNRISTAAGGAAARRDGVALNRAAPKGLRFSSEFYLRWALDNVMNALSFCTTQAESDSILFLLEALKETDEMMPYLTVADRKLLQKLFNPGTANQGELF